MSDMAEPSSDPRTIFDYARGGSLLDALCLMWQSLQATVAENLTMPPAARRLQLSCRDRESFYLKSKEILSIIKADIRDNLRERLHIRRILPVLNPVSEDIAEDSPEILVPCVAEEGA